MTIEANFYNLGSACNGTTRVFGIPWPFRDPADIVVQLIDTTNLDMPISPPPQLNGGGTYDYTITGTKDPDTGFYYSGGNITFNNAPPAIYEFFGSRVTQDWQDKSLPSNGRFPAKAVEAALDRRTLVDQEQNYLTGSGSGGSYNGRIVMMSPYDFTNFNPTLPSTQGKGGMLLGIDPTGGGWEWYSFANGPILNVIGTPSQIVVSPTTNAGQIQISLPPQIDIQANIAGQQKQFFQNVSPNGNALVAAANDLYSECGIQMLGSTFGSGAGFFPPDTAIFYSYRGTGGITIGTSAAAPIRFVTGYNAGGGEAARFDAAGNLGIGTTAPGNVVDVWASRNSAVSVVTHNQNTGASAQATVGASNAAHSVILGITGTSWAQVGAIGPDTAYVNASAAAGGLLLGTQAATPIVFATGSGTFSEIARFSASGLLGIGCVPNETYNIILDMKRNAPSGVVVSLHNLAAATAQYQVSSSSGAYGALAYNPPGGSYTAPYAGDQLVLQAAGGTGGLLVETMGLHPVIFAINENEVMRCGANGYVGVWNSNPQYHIDVASNSNSATFIHSSNISTANGCQAGFLASNSTHDFSICVTGTGFTDQPFWVHDLAYINASACTGGLALNSNALIKFGLNAAEAARIGAPNGYGMCIAPAPLGGFSAGAAFALHVPGGQNWVGMNIRTVAGGLYGIDIQQDNPTGSYIQLFRNSGSGVVGSITHNGSNTNFSTSSDLRLKENIKRAADAGDIIDAIEVEEWDWIVDGSHQSHGIVAQKLHKIFPLAVTPGVDGDGPYHTVSWMIDYSKLVPLLVAEVQSLRRRVDQLTKETRH